MLYQIGPNRWTTRAPETDERQRGPYIISDTMEPTEQVDGKFYTSKSKFRAVGRSLGLTEMGNDKPPPKKRMTESREFKEKRRETLKIAFERVRSG